MPETSTGGIQVGDAVIEFLGNTQQLDGSIDKLNDRIAEGMTRASQNVGQLDDALTKAGDSATEAGGEIDSAMGKSRTSTMEARGEAALLGEEFGIHLPRHVRNFVAEMPGVNQALSAAFSATAVLFLIEALQQGAEKIADWIAKTYIFTDAMKDSDAAIAAMNRELEKDAEDAEKANKALADFGKTASQLAADRVKELGAQKDALDTQFNIEQEQLRQMGTDYKTYGKTIDEVGIQFAETAAKRRAIIAELALAQKQAASEDEKDAKKSAAEWEKAADIRIKVSQHALDVVASNAALDQKTVTDSIKAQEAEYASLGATVEKVTPGFVSNWQQMIEAQMKARDAAHYFGQETKDELTEAVKVAVDNLMALQKEAGVTGVQLKNAGDQVLALQAKLNNFGKAPELATQNLKDLLDMTKQLSQAEVGFGDAFGSAMAKVVTGEEGVSQAMKQATGAVIEQIGQRALVQGMYDLGLGFAALASLQPEVAAQYFEASGILLAVGAGATAGGAAIAGSGSSSGGAGGGSYSGTGTTGITTSGGAAPSGPASTTTRLAGGGLITAPTMAMIGDSVTGGAANEGVLPLDNPEAMAKIAGTIAAMMPQVQAGHQFHMNVKGMVSDHDTKKLAKKLSRMVRQGTTQLQSSNTHRVTKRSP